MEGRLSLLATIARPKSDSRGHSADEHLGQTSDLVAVEIGGYDVP